MHTQDFLIPEWRVPPNVHAVSTLRTGGASRGPYQSFNLAAHVGDAPSCVDQNRRLLRDALSLPGEPAWLDQVHGADVVEAAAWSTPARADASVAHVANQVCAVLTADCLPVLFCSDDGLHVGVAHAGWRGLAAGVLEATVQALGAPVERLIVWLGPAIGQSAFEVGDDVRDAFMARDAASSDAFVRNAHGRWQCDLYWLARQSLMRLGVAQISGGQHCTHREHDKFFSYRRDGQCGRMATLIWRS